MIIYSVYVRFINYCHAKIYNGNRVKVSYWVSFAVPIWVIVLYLGETVLLRSILCN